MGRRSGGDISESAVAGRGAGGPRHVLQSTHCMCLLAMCRAVSASACLPGQSFSSEPQPSGVLPEFESAPTALALTPSEHALLVGLETGAVRIFRSVASPKRFELHVLFFFATSVAYRTDKSIAAGEQPRG